MPSQQLNDSNTQKTTSNSAPETKSSNGAIARQAAIDALKSADKLSKHFIFRWISTDTPLHHAIREAFVDEGESQKNLVKHAELTSRLSETVSELRKTRWWTRFAITSRYLRNFRSYEKRAKNALSKARTKVREEIAENERAPIWPTTAQVFPTDECKTTTQNALLSSLAQFYRSDEIIDFPDCPEPELSIIITVYNKPELLLRTLRALRDNAGTCCEVIIWDDCSTCEMESLYHKVKGVNIIRSKENLNFVLANNEAAKYARGEFLLLLNSDAAIRPNALSSSIETLRLYQHVGVVGGCLILPDGIVQEAGSVVWRDASCSCIGRGLLPDDIRLKSYRVVDYCSGAFFMTRTSLWHEMGGFDPQFAPAYYEETDFCLRLFGRGLLTIYNPVAQVDHYEFGTNGKNAAVDLMQRNREKLLKTHSSLLDGHPSQNDWRNYFLQRRTSLLQQKWLYIDDQFPSATSGSGLPRTRLMLQFLAQQRNCEVWYMATHEHKNKMTALSLSGDEKLRWVHRAPSKPKNNLVRFLQNEALDFDVIFVSRPHNKHLLNHAWNELEYAGKNKKPLVIYDAEAIYAERDIVKHRVLSGDEMPAAEQENLKSAEFRLVSDADIVVAVSESDTNKFKGSLTTAECFTLSHVSTLQPTPAGFKERNGLFFVGPLDGEDMPNSDAMRWLLNHVSPYLQERTKVLQLTHVGGRTTDIYFPQPKLNLNLQGPAESLTRYFNAARIFVCPVRYAAGISIKVIDAMSSGLPVVTTPLIADQMKLEHGRHVLIAESSEDFANCIDHLHENEDLWETLRQNSLEFIREFYSMDSFRKNADKMMASVRFKIGKRS